MLRSVRVPSTPIVALAVGAAAALLLGAPASASYPDWEAVADVETIEIVTHDADGEARANKIWFVLVDGNAYLRTSRSRWLENLRRDPDCVVRIEGKEYEVRAEELDGDAIVERVDALSAEKYGWQERVIHPFRLRKPEILILLPRGASADAPHGGGFYRK